MCPRRLILKTSILFFALLPWGYAQEVADNPLAPVKLESPRDTMRTFLTAMNEYRKGKITGNREQLAQIDKAVRCLDVQEASLVLQDEVGREAAIFLKEVIDRVIVIDYEKIPLELPKDAPPWRLRNTEITIARVDAGEDIGRYLFTKTTVKNARRYYEKVKHLPLLIPTGGAMYKEPWLERNVPGWARKTIVLFPNWKWLALFATLILGAFVRKLGEWLARAFQRFSQRAQLVWYLKIWGIIQRPFGWLVMSSFWFFMINALGFDGGVYIFLLAIVKIFMSAACVWIVYRLVNVMVDYVRTRSGGYASHLDNHVIQLIEKTFQIFVLVFGALLVFQNLGVNVMSVLAGLGLGGLAFALAAKDACANLFGSLMIVMDRSYKIGDFIRIGKFEGTVEEVGFRSTRLRTPENSLVSLPNALIANESIDNIGRRHFRRALYTLGLVSNTPVEKIREFQAEILKLLENGAPAIQRDSCSVVFNGINSDHLEIRVEFFLSVTNVDAERTEKERILFSILEIAEKIPVAFAYPTRTVHVEALPTGRV